MSTPTAPRPMFSLGNILFLLLPLAAAVGLVVYYQINQLKQSVEPVDYVRSVTGYMKRDDGLLALDKRYSDTDGDLLADPPSDPAKLQDPAKLVFTPLPGSKPDTPGQWKEFLAHVEKVTGKTVEYLPRDSHQEQLEALRNGALHLTGFNTGLVPTAVHKSGFHPLAAMAGPDGKIGYTMQFLVRADEPVKSLSDLKPAADARPRAVTFTSAGSHSGFKAALIALRDEAGLRPGTEFTFTMSGGHDASLVGLAKKQYATVAVASDMLARATAAGVIKEGQYRTISTSKSFPPAAYGIPHNLKPELAAKLKEALLTFPWAGTGLEAAYKGSGYSQFVPVNYKTDWQFVREIDQKMVDWNDKP